ncbi:MAG: hypothetical protein R2755_11640 [Acidimicrobiales bacterium]
MRDLLLARTDAGVLAQVITVAAVTLGATVALRHRREVRTFAPGVGVFLLALMAARALH